MSLWTRIRNSLQPESLNREIENEVQSHIDEMQAMGEPKSAFGSALQYREDSYDIKTIAWLDSLRADVIFGWRQLLKRKTVTAAAILSLALGIGATTSAFRLIEAGFLRPLAIRNPEQLHFLRYSIADPNGGVRNADSFSYREMLEMRDSVKEAAEILMVSFADRQDISYGGPADVEKVSRQYVNGAMFDIFGLRPAAGRLFGRAEDLTGADHQIAVISNDYWQRRFGRDPSAIGKTFRYGGNSFTIVGVLEPSFTGTSTGAFTDVFLPLLANREPTLGAGVTHWRWARILVYLRPHAAPGVVAERLDASFRNLRDDIARTAPPGTSRRQIDAYRSARVRMLPAWRGISNFHRDYLAPIGILAATAIMVLLLCCASVANLLIAQALARSREMALRIAIGAGRARLMQLVLIESLMLALAAASLGMLFSWQATPFVVSMLNPPDNPVRLILNMDVRVLLAGVGLTFAVTLLFGVLPAIHASSVNPMESMKGGSERKRRFGAMRTLVVVQVTFCFLVCFLASLMASSLRHLEQSPLGFDPSDLLQAEVETISQPATAETWRQVAIRARELPGVVDAAWSGWPLQIGGTSMVDLELAGGKRVSAQMLIVGPGWLSTTHVGITAGRDFLPDEQEPTVLINQKFAGMFFEGRSPLGATFLAYKARYRIIGVTADIRTGEVREPVRPTVFFPFGRQRYGSLTLRVANGVRESDLARPVRQLIAGHFPELRVVNVRTQQDLILMQTVRERLLAALSMFFGAVALIVAGVGLYGVLSYAVSQRRREIAVRMSLGARSGEVVWPFVRESISMLAIGIAAGLVLGLNGYKIIRSLLYEVSGSDPAVLASSIMALVPCGLLAAAAPSIRATRIDPVRILRE